MRMCSIVGGGLSSTSHQVGECPQAQGLQCVSEPCFSPKKSSKKIGKIAMVKNCLMV